MRYEALFQLLDELRPLDDVEAAARLCAARWKYIAQPGAWRLVLAQEPGFLCLTAHRGSVAVQRLEALPPWDAHHWRTQHPCIIDAGAAPEPAWPPELALAGGREVLVMPIARAGVGVALLGVASKAEPFSALDRKFIPLLGTQLADHLLHAALRQRELEALRARACTDALTGALNRAAILDRLQGQLALSRRTRVPLALLIADADHFKRVNDGYGHSAGDEVLRELCRRFRILARASECFGRYGGEEFLFVLYPCGAQEALGAGNRIRAGIAAAPFVIDPATGQALAVTISLGAASTDGDPAASAETLIRRADEALYRSKADGRNRLTLATPPPRLAGA
ncbi:MAG: GGDEF domain-containing protein [Burkholderiales bacterium]|nr:GGDEF domain-containing protein [Burkholderiales bacterium]MDE1925946.1 GGDEF domain-containing protein [Burkholderiales bacterium]MDE2159811.1 GGDEF domain-containing protein [Burkholderiales bacterium]MDE2503492.1 GGDEF domain-containing protein [Burkholderiales bacterium]